MFVRKVRIKIEKDIQNKSLKSWDNLKDFFKILLEDFFNISIIIIIAILWLTGRVATWFNIKNTDEIIFSIFISLLIPIVIAYIKHFAGYKEPLTDLDEKHSIISLLGKDFFDIVKRNPEKSGVIKSIYAKYNESFGGIIVGANEKKYIELISNFLHFTSESFFATLRGGEDNPKYTIDWFFTDSTVKRTGGLVLDKRRKQEYLKKVNSARIKKIRIIILKTNEMSAFKNDYMRNSFFKMNSKVGLFRISPEKMEHVLINNSIHTDKGEIKISENETSFIREDYAVFDENIVVKHNGKNYLYLGFESQIRKMLLPFLMLDEHKEFYEKIDSKGIYQYISGKWEFKKNWEDWKKGFENSILLNEIEAGIIGSKEELAKRKETKKLLDETESNIILKNEYEKGISKIRDWNDSSSSSGKA